MIGRARRTRAFGDSRTSWEALEPECNLVTIDRRLGPAELERVASLLSGREDVTLRFHSRAARDLEFLRHFPGLRRLSIDLWELEDIAGFSHLQHGLELLHFGKTRKRFSLRFLDAMPLLQKLSLVGHTKDIAVVRGLSSLTAVELRGITLPDLSILTSKPQLAAVSLLLGGTTNLCHLAELPRLEILNLMRITKLADVSVLRELAALRILNLDWMRNITSLPSLAPLAHLEEVSLETMKGLTDLSAVAAAPALRRLTIEGMPQLDAAAFRCLIGHPCLSELRLIPSLGGVNLKKAVLEAVRQLLPEIVRPPAGFRPVVIKRLNRRPG